MVPAHTVISTVTARLTIQDSHFGWAIGALLFPGRGSEGRPVSRFSFLLAESAASPGVSCLPHPLSLLPFNNFFSWT